MSRGIQKLDIRHRTVAKYLALGFSLERIFEYLVIPRDQWDNWKKVCDGTVFKREVSAFQDELGEKILEDNIKDSTFLEMRMASAKAAKRLVSEMDNFDTEVGASSSTRIKASESILDRTGYSKGAEQDAGKGVVINISAAKLDSVFGSARLANIPETVSGPEDIGL